MRNSFFLAIILSLSATAAFAQIPTSGNVFFGYSYYNTDPSGIDRIGTNGWDATVEGKILPFIGIIGDFSAHYGSENFAPPCSVGAGVTTCPLLVNVNVAEHDYLFGPRVSVSLGKFRPFAEGMIGVAHINANAAGSDNSFASALGGGLDYRLLRILGWRVEGDYVHTRLFGNAESNVRLSTGIVVRF